MIIIHFDSLCVNNHNSKVLLSWVLWGMWTLFNLLARKVSTADFEANLEKWRASVGTTSEAANKLILIDEVNSIARTHPANSFFPMIIGMLILYGAAWEAEEVVFNHLFEEPNVRSDLETLIMSRAIPPSVYSAITWCCFLRPLQHSPKVHTSVQTVPAQQLLSHVPTFLVLFFMVLRLCMCGRQQDRACSSMGLKNFVACHRSEQAVQLFGRLCTLVKFVFSMRPDQ